MSSHLHIELEKLKRRLLNLGATVENCVERSVQSVLARDKDLGSKVIEGDSEIDQREIDIEEDCLKILALYQPVAVDLRFLISVLKINNDLERIGDLAVNIAERGLFLLFQPSFVQPFDMQEMTRKTRSMLRKALDSLVTQDPILAAEVCSEDEELDKMNRSMYKNVYEEIKKDPQRVEQLIQYLSISRNLERIGDYATNIAEDVIYMVDGHIVRHKTNEFITSVGHLSQKLTNRGSLPPQDTAEEATSE
ncbi:MAG: phosphate signaling complex protein PhoU [Bdellovibrionota bacterium]